MEEVESCRHLLKGTDPPCNYSIEEVHFGPKPSTTWEWLPLKMGRQGFRCKET